MKVKTSEKIRALRSFEELKCGVGGQQRALHQPPRVAAAAASVGDYAHCPFERHTGSSRWSCCQHCATIATDSATIAAAVLQLRDRLRAAAAAAVEAAEAPWHAGVSRRPPPPRAACQGRASATHGASRVGRLPPRRPRARRLPVCWPGSAPAACCLPASWCPCGFAKPAGRGVCIWDGRWRERGRDSEITSARKLVQG